MNTFSALFKISTYTAAFAWAVMIFFPNWEYTDFLIKNIVVILLSVLYVYLLFFRKNIEGTSYPKGGFTSLKGVMNLFLNPKGVLLGSVHYLAFDLLVGLFIKTQANEIGMSHYLQIPCFLLAFMFGPVGYLLFVLMSLFIA